MKTGNQTQPQLSGFEEKIRIIRLGQVLPFKLTNSYYAKKLNRTPGAIAQALNDYKNTATLLARISRHNDWLENKYNHKSIQKN